MGHSFKYVGCFLKAEELYEKVRDVREGPLPIAVEHPHVTFQYRPQDVDQGLFGQRIQVEIAGYGNDGRNEGLCVRIFAPVPKFQAMLRGIERPNIKLTVSREGEAVNTRELEFSEITPVRITGIYGGCTEEKEIILGNRNPRT